jgi:hypothetical protein
MIVDIHYKLQHFNSSKDERLCFMCAVRAASVYPTSEARIKLKSGRKPFKCAHCDMFIHDTLDTGEEPEKECCGGCKKTNFAGG